MEKVATDLPEKPENMVSFEDFKDPEGHYDGRLVARMSLGPADSQSPPADLVVVAMANMPADGSTPRVSVVREHADLSLEESARFGKAYANLLASIHRRMARINPMIDKKPQHGPL